MRHVYRTTRLEVPLEDAFWRTATHSRFYKPCLLIEEVAPLLALSTHWHGLEHVLPNENWNDTRCLQRRLGGPPRVTAAAFLAVAEAAVAPPAAAGFGADDLPGRGSFTPS